MTFELAGDLYGLDVRRVQEVLADQAVTPVPLAPPEVAGLVNLRGQVVTALELRRRLGLPARPRTSGAVAPHVVVRDGEDVVALVVDALGDVVEVADDDVQPPPDTLTGPLADLVTGACPLPDRLLLPLDVDALVAPAGTAPSRPAGPSRTDPPRRTRP
ncbi:chemotaxis protein CheW [Pseudokineococcus basanitobsidens]|uniref:Chemotaxis protein CheW n=1 Tax=Pseudokineococcus basanitobsidens TaxID=1926649 RepID=A0ABU8RG30_9ACTN